MKWLKKVFNKNIDKEIKSEAKHVHPMPSWEKIVELLYDKYLDAFCDEIINVSVSGEIIEKIESESKVTSCCIVELGRDHSRRVLVCGKDDGFIDFYCLGEKVSSQKRGKVSILFVNSCGNKVTVVDAKRCSYVISIDESVGRCIKCGSLTDKKCYQCQKYLCASCSVNGLCRECCDRVNSPIASELL